MSPDEALHVLTTMADRGMGNGADHRAVSEAVAVLQSLVESDSAIVDSEE